MSKSQSVSMGLAGMVVAGLMVVGSQASAASIDCFSQDDDRFMTLTPKQGTASCAGVGSFMVDVSNQKNLGLKPFHENDLGLAEIEDYSDWLQVDGLNDVEGRIEIKSNDLYSQYSDVHLAFFFGNPQLIQPNWMSYSLDGVLDAKWQVSTNEGVGQGDANPALSNVTLWGNKAAHSVPAPGALGLFTLGLMGLAGSRLRRSR